MSGNVHWDGRQWIVRGVPTQKLLGRSSFKFANLLSMHFAGMGDEYPRGAAFVAEEWVAHNQRLFGRADVVLRGLGESAGWPPIPAGSGMFGSPPNDAGIHDVAAYRVLCERNQRITELTELHSRVLEEAFRISETTGCIFEWPIDATLKHTDGMCVGIIDHAIRQVAEEMRELSEKYPGAAFIVSARNEWNAWNQTGHTLGQVNQWATRWYRWKKEGEERPAVSFESPGDGWEAEQWPEAMLIVDHGGKDTFDYECGREAGKFQMGAVHPERKGGAFVGRSEWNEVTPEWIARLRQDARGAPIGVTECMYLVSKSGTSHWYRNRNGWNEDLPSQIQFLYDLEGPFDYLIVHDDIGVQTDTAFNPGSQWEDALAELFGGGTSGPPPPPAKRYRYAHIIGMAYQSILARPVDPEGLENYNRLMTDGMSEAAMREALIRSAEYAEKNPA